MPSYKLTYFEARGRGETSRMLFALSDTEYEDNRVSDDDFPKLKPTLPFGQVPTLEVDGEVLCQSHAIERLLARRFGFAGKSDIEQARVDMLVDCIADIEQGLIRVYEEKDERKKELAKKLDEETLPQQFGYLNKFLEKNGGGSGFFVGSSITMADIAFANSVEWIPLVGQTYDPFAEFPKLKALSDRVKSNPKIAAWIEKRPKSEF